MATPTELLTHLRQQFDWRVSVCEIDGELEANQLRLRGQLLDRADHALLLRQLQVARPELEIHDQIEVLVEGPSYGWALAARNVLNVRREPRHGAELLTQATWGAPLEILRRQEGWAFVRMADGYLGWVVELGLHPVARAAALGYRAAATHVVCARLAACHDERGQQVSLLPFATPVVAELAGERAVVDTPFGARWVARAADLVAMADRPGPTAAGIGRMLDHLHPLIGTPYLWGGSSPFGYDCSGLAQAAYAYLGLSLPRDADMQARCGQPADPAARQPGDLIFFTSHGPSTDDAVRANNITHVALALDGDRILHANQRHWGITANSLSPAQADTFPDLAELIVAVRRVREEA